jgi:hypothetical protein
MNRFHRNWRVCHNYSNSDISEEAKYLLAVSSGEAGTVAP